MEMLLRRFIYKMVRLAGFKAFSVNFSVYVLFRHEDDTSWKENLFM